MADGGVVTHDQSHVKDLTLLKLPRTERTASVVLRARASQQRKAIMGVFDEGCMGMFNAIIPANCSIPPACSVERLSHPRFTPRSASDGHRAREALSWLLAKGMNFDWGPR